MSSPDLIDDLVEDLAPVERASAVGTSALLWTGVSVAVVMGVVWATGPLRPGWVDQLWASPRFVLENLSGLLFAAAAMAAAFALATPGAVKREQALGVVALAWAAWVALLLYGVADPALAPSMEGKRPYCVQEIWVWSVPPLLGAIALLDAGIGIAIAGQFLSSSARHRRLENLIH